MLTEKHSVLPQGGYGRPLEIYMKLLAEVLHLLRLRNIGPVTFLG